MQTMSYRCLYAAAHFGNSYEVMGPRETDELLAGAREWGFNAYCDWFDCADLKNPAAAGTNVYLTPQAFMEQKVRVLSQAHKAGLAVSLAITPNHVWLDQLAPELLATSDNPGHIFGQLICPSRPAARKIILDNHRYLFDLLRQAGVELESIFAAPYDYGGCACPKCQPWIVTFGKLALEILALARQTFPRIQGRLMGWWWTPQEHELFRDWADAQAPGVFQSLARHIQYGQTRPADGMVLPKGCAQHAFVHIGYADQAQPRDVYGPWGPVVSPVRLEATLRDLLSTGTIGFTAYSEGQLDDVNKAILAGIASGRFANTQEVLEAYAERYFGAAGTARADWANWLRQWGKPFEADADAAQRDLALLARGAKESWRLEQWRLKAQLLAAHARARVGDAWPAARLGAAEEFFATQEKLYRGVWGLGLVRHVLNPRFHRPAWYESYQQAIKSAGSAATHEAQA